MTDPDTTSTTERQQPEQTSKICGSSGWKQIELIKSSEEKDRRLCDGKAVIGNDEGICCEELSPEVLDASGRPWCTDATASGSRECPLVLGAVSRTLTRFAIEETWFDAVESSLISSAERFRVVVDAATASGENPIGFVNRVASGTGLPAYMNLKLGGAEQDEKCVNTAYIKETYAKEYRKYARMLH